MPEGGCFVRWLSRQGNEKEESRISKTKERGRNVQTRKGSNRKRA